MQQIDYVLGAKYKPLVQKQKKSMQSDKQKCFF
jgi:hypothetical protein